MKVQRKIIFRGKRKDLKVWVEGYLIETEKQSYIMLKQAFIPAISMPSERFIEVIPETVGQYFGKMDKNNRIIFEGDILEINYKVLSDIIKNKYEDLKTICKVISKKDGWGIEYISGFQREFRNLFESPDSFKFHPEDSRIIGNIYDNPELLKKHTSPIRWDCFQ